MSLRWSPAFSLQRDLTVAIHGTCGLTLLSFSYMNMNTTDSSWKGGIAVAEKNDLSKEAFLGIAEESGLAVDHSHLEDLYAYLQGLRPTLKAIEDMDVSGWEPFMPSLTRKEEPR